MAAPAVTAAAECRGGRGLGGALSRCAIQSNQSGLLQLNDIFLLGVQLCLAMGEDAALSVWTRLALQKKLAETRLVLRRLHLDMLVGLRHRERQWREEGPASLGSGSGRM